MSRTVADNALMLKVLAGPDGLDPRQSALAQPKRYTDALDGNIESMRIGVLKEGFGHFNAEDDVEESVRAAAELFKKLTGTATIVVCTLG
jgi:amidase